MKKFLRHINDNTTKNIYLNCRSLSYGCYKLFLNG